MTAQIQEIGRLPLPDEPPSPDQIAAIHVTISSSRFATYLKAAGYAEVRALSLYLWNAQVGEAFHTPIQAVEIGLRNRVNDALGQEFTPNWWECANLYQLLDEERKGDLSTVLKRIRNRELELCTDQVGWRPRCCWNL